MKRFLAPILLVTLLFPSFALGLEMDDLVERGGLYYEKFTNVPFTGEVTGLEQGAFRDGKREGPWVFFEKDGTKRTTPEKVGIMVFDEGSGTYKNGEKVK